MAEEHLKVIRPNNQLFKKAMDYRTYRQDHK